MEAPPERAHAIRMKAIDELAADVAGLTEARGARRSRHLREQVPEPGATSPTGARGGGVNRAVKSKSMATEEIGLNEALAAAGSRRSRPISASTSSSSPASARRTSSCRRSTRRAEQVASCCDRGERIPHERRRSTRGPARGCARVPDRRHRDHRRELRRSSPGRSAGHEQGQRRLVSSIPRVHVA